MATSEQPFLDQPDNSSLRNIYDFFNSVGGLNMASTEPGRAHGGEAGMGSTAEQWLDWDNQGQVRFNEPEALQGVVQRNPGVSNSENPNPYFNINWGMLPETRYGSVMGTSPITEATRLHDPNNWYEDSNFGRITDSRNIYVDNSLDFIPSLLMSAAMAGFGGLIGPGLGQLGIGAVNAGRAAGSGDWLGVLGSLLGPVGNLSGLPRELTTLARLGLNAYRQFGGGRG